MICKKMEEKHATVLPVFDPDDSSGCVVDYCKNLMDYARKESCGQCVFCREGTWQIYAIINDITEGLARSDDYELLLDILLQMEQGASCEMTREAAGRCIRLMREQEEEWDKHLRRKRCTNLVCRCSYTLYIDPGVCDGCGKCLEVVPAGAISGGEGMIHIINSDSAAYAGLSPSICPRGAVKKAGPVKPKLPAEPVLAGSFTTEEASGEGDTSRRRRRRG